MRHKNIGFVIMVIKKISYISDIPDDFTTKNLHANDFPPGWEEISPEVFAQSSFFVYSPEYLEYRQMISGEKLVCAKLFHFHDGTGYAISNDYWNKKIKYFRFGCNHEYKELSPDEAVSKGVVHYGHCYHVYQCKKCNRITSQDSSD